MWRIQFRTSEAALLAQSLQSPFSRLLSRSVLHSSLDKRSCIACTEWQQGACEALGRGRFAELARRATASHP